MKKSLLTLAIITLFVSASFAQGKFSIGAELGLPTGDFADVAGFGIGGSARYEGIIKGNFNWTVTAGYVTFLKKEVFGVDITNSMIPVQAGLKYYFTESFNGFYGGAEVGMHNYKVKVSGFGSDSETFLSYAPSLGYHFANIDISARYQIISDNGENIGYFGIRVGGVLGGK